MVAECGINVLFVCLGNICRSPALASTLRSIIEKKGLSDRIKVDSCGIYNYFLNSKADPSIREVANGRGIQIDTRAKMWDDKFFTQFDLIFVVDISLLEMLKSRATTKTLASKVHLATEYSEKYTNQEIPDPYMGGKLGFEHVMDIAEDACAGIAAELMRAL